MKMTRKQWLNNLYEEALQDLQDFNKFQSFLEYKSRLYKYDFANSLLLWKQVPNATMVADLEIWNRFSRRVEKGTKSSFIYDYKSGSSKSVFDISQTYPTKEVSIQLWEYEAEKSDYVREQFMKENKAEDNPQMSTERMIQDVVFTQSLEMTRELNEKIKSLNLENELRRKIEVAALVLTGYSVDTIVSKRVGYQLKGINIEEVKSFYPYLSKQKGILNLVGNNITKISKNILTGIERSVKEYDREKNIYRPGERDGVHRGGRWDVSSEHRTIRRGALQHYGDGLEVESLHARKSSGEISGTRTQARAEKEDVGSGRRSVGNDKADRSPISGEESVRSGGLSGHHNQNASSEELRQRDSGERVFIPFSLEDFKQSMIDYGSPFDSTKYRIHEFFLKNEDEKDRIAFLKKEYGIGGYTYDRKQNQEDKWHIYYDSKGMSFEQGEQKNGYSWKEVVKTLSNLMEKNRYFTVENHNKYPQYRQKKVLSLLEREKAYWDYENNRDELFLFGKKYEIVEIKEDSILVLRESKFPLNTLEIRKVDFEKEAMKNCQNDDKWITEEKVLLQSNQDVKAWVRVVFSENADIPEQALFPFSVSNSLFEKFDTEKQQERENEDYEGSRYDKTWFCLTVKLEDGRIVELKERQDLGDGYGSLYNFLSSTNVSPEILLVLNEELTKNTEKEIKELKEEIKLVESTVPAAEERKVDDILSEAGIGEKKKFEWNYEAIELLKNLEEEDREPSFDEKQKLKLFLGWGGLSGVFDESKQAWEKERQALKELLTEKEYEEARASTPNSHYTPDFVIDEIHNYLSNYDIKTLLEPSAGTGRFLKNTERVTYTAIELDSIPARIMKKLYPQANVMIGGYEEMELTDNSYDAVIGNVPFGNYGLFDKRYEKENFLIHDYFFAKSIDKVKDNGLVVLVTGKGTMDKENDAVRKYISKRAELLGAIRLPSSVFSKIAGTDASADILFLRKRSKKASNENEWTGLGYTEDKVPVNEYYIKHPEHLLGKMEFDHRFFGASSKYTNCFIEESADIRSMLKSAFNSIAVFKEQKEIVTETEDTIDIEMKERIEDFTYVVIDNDFGKKAYYRNGENLEKSKLGKEKIKTLESMIAIRSHILLMLKEQREGCTDEKLVELQSALQKKYDDFVREHGEISLPDNQKLFEKDRYSAFLFSLEQKDRNGQRIYSPIFSERIIKPAQVITHANSVGDAFLICLNEKGKVNLPYMRSLLGEEWEDKDIVERLKGKIMFNPGVSEYETAEEYLSGNVRSKLKYVESLLKQELPEELKKVLEINRKALKEVIPQDLVAAEIEVRLGTTWIEKEDYEQFIYETLKVPNYLRFGNPRIGVEFNPFTNAYYISNKSMNTANILVYQNFGTERKNAYEIIESTLNLKNIRIYDKVVVDGKEKRVLNAKETMLAKEKQDIIKQEFKDWIWKDERRRKKYEKYYNETFNAIALRKYNGEFLSFPDMNPAVNLHQHQKEAIARCLTSRTNTLFAHAVGAGKTYEMIASCMEGKRIGLWQKALFVVPNHLTQQTGIEFLHLYPSANILVATEDDFKPKNRELFFAKMATGNFDAIIIGQTQLIKIGLSKEREIRSIKKEISEVTEAIRTHKDGNSESWTTKNMEVFKKKLEKKLRKLLQATEKTKLLSFEDLNIDQMFIDEAHDFKSLPIHTKMNNVAGISNRQSQRAIDLYLKIDYLKEHYLEKEGKERGVVFATATPISNSMAELYVMQKYLQSGTLKERGIRCFDDWASSFGETTTALELAPEGIGFRLRTRFGKFVNLPELLSIFQEVADIKTDKMLNLPKPKANYHTLEIQPLSFTKTKVFEYSERAEEIRSGNVDPKIDNMLKITHEGRLLGTDPRLLYEELSNEEIDGGTKLDRVVDSVYQIHKETEEKKMTQIIFSDVGVPAKNNEVKFTAYDYVKEKLIEKGIPEEEICFIHDAKNNKQKQELFNKIKSGEKRIIFGSTPKMGTGTNIQDKAIALHHIDCPWKSSDIEQREGRIIRPGNTNDTVDIYRYVTKSTFDGYLWQIVEQKQRFIDQVMNNKLVSRTAEDIDDRALTFAEVKAIATGNPIIVEKIELDMQIAKLEILKANFQKQKNQQSLLLEQLPERIQNTEKYLLNLQKDMALSGSEEDKFFIQLDNVLFEERARASEKLEELYLKFLQQDKFKAGLEAITIGEYQNFSISMKRTDWGEIELRAKANEEYRVSSESIVGVLTKLSNKLSTYQFEKEISEATLRRQEFIQNKEEILSQLGKEFPQEEELKKAKLRAKEIEDILNIEESSIYEGIEESEETENENDNEMEM